MAVRIAVDVGGTFTDLALVGNDRNLNISKSPTTPEDHALGVLSCVDLVSEGLGRPPAEVMAECAYFAHGSTIITNAVIEGKVAKVGLLVTKGFRDILTIREGGKDDPYRMHENYPQPYVPRYLTRPVLERINAEGGVEIPLDEAGAEAALRELIEKYQVEAVAVCFLWSIANPVHELKIREIIERNWPGFTCILSSEANPIIREYRRASSTVIEASVRNLARRYVSSTDDKLKGKGFRGTLYIITSSGSVLAAADASRKAVSMIASGPSMAPVASRWIAELEGDGTGNVISVDMGGTSFDVSIVKEGRIARTRETKIGHELLGVSTIDARSIGAGGGSITWIDPAGLIHVGPQSAGAIPGPACYKHGGQEPTVTDANVILGYIDPGYFLGGRMEIDPDLAARVITDKIARPLHLGLEEAAFTIWSTINVNMVAAIQDVTIWQGIDPREYVLVSGGGAGNCHAVALARELGIKRLLVPKFGGVLSAVGGLVADVQAEFSGSCFTGTHRFNFAGVQELLQKLESEAQNFLDGLETEPEETAIEFYVEARYPYQVWELPIRLRKSRIETAEDLAVLVEDFHAEHENVFAIKEPPGSPIECVNWSARAIARTPKLGLREQARGGSDPAKALMSTRKAYFREKGGLIETRIYKGDLLEHGNTITGPSIIEETTTTIVIPPQARATVSRWGNYNIETMVA
ncbi:MAG: hydantoinase/oxoprolinase family protein [Thermodesulfobacteriota bacterium]